MNPGSGKLESVYKEKDREGERETISVSPDLRLGLLWKLKLSAQFN